MHTYIPAICNGLITQTGACRSSRYIKRYNKTVHMHGKCYSPGYCDCSTPDTKQNYFYAKGPFCKG